jgi:hypothetical protein
MIDYCTKLVAEIFTIMKNDLFSVLSGRIQFFELFLPPAFFLSFLFFLNLREREREREDGVGCDLELI